MALLIITNEKRKLKKNKSVEAWHMRLTSQEEHAALL